MTGAPISRQVENRIGRFIVTDVFLHFWESTNPDLARAALKKLFSSVIIFRCERKGFQDDYYEYLAWSEDFEVVAQGSEPPTYVAGIATNMEADGTVKLSVTWDKV